MGHLAIVLSWHRDYIPSFVLSVYYTQTFTTTNNRNQSKTNVLLNKYEFCTTGAGTWAGSRGCTNASCYSHCKLISNMQVAMPWWCYLLSKVLTMFLQHRGGSNELCPLRRRGTLLIPREEVVLNQTFKNEGKRECWGGNGRSTF